MSKILVTGAAGFVGSHVADLLLADGHVVDSIDCLEAGVDFTPAGVRNKDTIRLASIVSRLPDPEGYDVIVHAAARADVSANWQHDIQRDRIWASNIDGTVRLLEAAHNTGGAAVIFLSTCAVYGDNDDCRERDACHATSPYAASKLAGEAIVESYCHKWGKPAHVLRLGCVVGNRYHHGHVADFVRMARSNTGIQPRSSGEGKKSFVHVGDVARAARLALRGDMPAGTYNLGGGTWSPRDTVRVMGLADRVSWPTKVHGWVGDPMAIAHADKAKAHGWRPMRSIENGVRDALRWLEWGAP